MSYLLVTHIQPDSFRLGIRGKDYLLFTSNQTLPNHFDRHFGISFESTQDILNLAGPPYGIAYHLQVELEQPFVMDWSADLSVTVEKKASSKNSPI